MHSLRTTSSWSRRQLHCTPKILTIACTLLAQSCCQGPEGVLYDTSLIWSNAIAYNNKGDAVYKMAEEMQVRLARIMG